MESTPKVRESSQPRIRDLEKEELLREPSESLNELVALLALVQERSGGVTRKSRGSSQAPSLLQVVESRAESNSVQERSGGATRKSRRSSPAPSPPPGVESRTEPSSLTKRKATNQREPLQDLGGAPREEEDRKRPRRQACKGTPKRTPTRREPVRLRKAKEARKQAPNTRRNNISHKDKTQDKEEPKAVEKPENQRDQTAREQDKGAPDKEVKAGPNPADPSSGPRKYRILSPLLPWTAKDIERRKILGQNPKFLGALEKSLVKKKKELDISNQELKENPLDELAREKVAQIQRRVRLFEDTIHRVKEGTYHQR